MYTCNSILTKKLFPNLSDGDWGCMYLEHYGKLLVETFATNPFINPYTQDNFVQAFHKLNHLKYSSGGYLEDRSTFMRGQYQKPGEVIHLGVDYNVPLNTEVSIPVPAKLVYSLQDKDQNGGWGGKLIFEYPTKPMYFILGHLKKIVTELDRVYQPGEIVGHVAESCINGNWYPHLHLQCVAKSVTALDTEVDGYGPMYDDIQKDYPDPELVFGDVK